MTIDCSVSRSKTSLLRHRLDHGLKNITEALKQHKMWSNTLLWLSADNGGDNRKDTSTPHHNLISREISDRIACVYSRRSGFQLSPNGAPCILLVADSEPQARERSRHFIGVLDLSAHS